MRKQPMVSVLVMTFNRVTLIQQALDSILAQKTDFAIEIVVGDNASTDGTQKLLNDYQKRFADTIRLRLSDVNEGCCVNFAKTHDLCSGKYIAICDSDDHWIDPYKLARQVAFLEANPDYNWMSSSCIGFANDRLARLDTLRFRGKGSHPISVASLEQILQRQTDPKMVVTSMLSHISTWLFRNDLTLYPAWYHYPHRYSYDVILSFMLEMKGKHYHDGLYLSTAMSYQDDGWSAAFIPNIANDVQKSREHLEDWFSIIADLREHLDHKSHAVLDEHGERLLLIAFKKMRRDFLHMKWQFGPYLSQLACYISDELLAKYSNKGRWGQMCNHFFMKGLRHFARKKPALFASSLILPVE